MSYLFMRYLYYNHTFEYNTFEYDITLEHDIPLYIRYVWIKYFCIPALYIIVYPILLLIPLYTVHLRFVLILLKQH